MRIDARRNALLLAMAAGAFGAESRAQAPAPDPALLERVEVVGSRIRRIDVETARPVFVLEREDLERTGLASVGDILQRITTHGADLNTTFNNGGNGETRIDLRNLGANRTLVLVNGRRWSTTLDGAVDLSSIPLAIVERIEVLKDGASAIYGSDAIAGVVNITTRAGYAGAEASAYLGENAEGDGRVESYDFTVGAAGERASATLNVSYLKQEPIFAGDREISAVPIFGLPPNDLASGASGTTPFGQFGFGPTGTCRFNPSGVYPQRCLPVGPVLPRTTYDPVTRTYRDFARATDGYNFAPENYLQTPQERTALYAQARYALTPAVGFSTELLYNERRSSQQLAPSPITLTALGAGLLNFTIPASNLYNPFGQDVRFTSFRPGGQVRAFRQDADTFRVGAGLDGLVDVFGRAFAWNLDAIHTETSVAKQTGGQVDLARLRDALGPSFRDAAGVAQCGTPTAPIAGCVPFDPFRGPGAYTPQMLDYVYFTAQNADARELTSYSTNVTGDLFELPAGPLGFAAGYEYRREQGRQTTDALLRTGNTSTGAVGEVGFSGTSSVDELYAEFAIPLLADRPFADLLELEVAARHSEYSSFGATTNFKAGFRWRPAASVVVRGTRSDGFRAPSLFELFTPTVVGVLQVDFNDPCASSFVQADPALRAGCAADGVPGGVYFPDSPVFGYSEGGNPRLLPETATTKTLGIVYSPAWLPGFDLTLDRFDVEIDDAITFVGVGTVLLACSADGIAEACDRTERNPATGALQRVDAGLLNSGVLSVKGYDLSIDYAMQTRVGEFRFNWESVYLDEYVTEVPRGAGTASRVGNYFVTEPTWRLRANLGLAWSRADHGASIAARYYSSLDEACVLAPQNRFVCSDPDFRSPTFRGAGENEIPERWYFDAQVYWNAPWHARVALGVHNVLDEDPPIVRSTFANSFDPQYPVPGRFWYASITKKF